LEFVRPGEVRSVDDGALIGNEVREEPRQNRDGVPSDRAACPPADPAAECAVVFFG